MVSVMYVIAISRFQSSFYAAPMFQSVGRKRVGECILSDNCSRMSDQCAKDADHVKYKRLRRSQVTGDSSTD